MKRLLILLVLALPLAAEPRERLIDIGTHKLFVRQDGSGAGPTVVFESGMNQPLDTWNKVFPEVARFANVFAYDRSGYGKSEPGPEAPVARQTARELRELLRRAGAKPPFVLVGHSLGGTYVRVFAKMYPKEVAGLVLADPAMVWRLDQFTREEFPEIYWEGEKQRAERRNKLADVLRREYNSIPVSEDEARAAWPLPNIPMIVLTGTKPHGMFARPEDDVRYVEGWARIHKEELVDRMPGAKHVLLPDTSHMIPAANPKAIVDAVREILGR